MVSAITGDGNATPPPPPQDYHGLEYSGLHRVTDYSMHEILNNFRSNNLEANLTGSINHIFQVLLNRSYKNCFFPFGELSTH